MPTATHESTWDARIARARELASSRPAARDLLTFYAALAEYQRTLAASARDLEAVDVEAVVEAIPGFLAWLRQNGRGSISPHRSTSTPWLPPQEEPVTPPSAEPRVPSPEPQSENPATLFVIESLLQAFAEYLPSREHACRGLDRRCAALTAPRCPLPPS